MPGHIEEHTRIGQELKTSNQDIPAAPERSNIRCGYFIGIMEDGRIVLKVVGSKPKLSTIIYLHDYVQRRMDRKDEVILSCLN